MANTSMQDIAQKMRKLDIATFTTVSADGTLAGRPMSNNGDVEYDGKSFYFTYEQANLVGEIGRNPNVQLAFEGEDDLYVAVSGNAELIRDKGQFEAHWQPQLEKWFDKGVDTPGIVLVCVMAGRVKYWKGMETGRWQA